MVGAQRRVYRDEPVRFIRRHLLFVPLLAFSVASFAAPFCVVSGAGTQCNYFDFGNCQQAARTLGGTCIANAGSQGPVVQSPSIQRRTPSYPQFNAAPPVGPGLPALLMQMQEQRAQQEQLKAQKKMAEAQAELTREQARRLKLENDERERQLANSATSQGQPNDSDLMARWQKAAAPRMGLYPDFQQVVMSADVEISLAMVEWMAGSGYAADVAYYLGKHKQESTRIAHEDPDTQAQSLRVIEAGFAK